MRPETVVAFWASVAAAAFLLGGTISFVEAAIRHPSAANDVLLILSLVGLVAAWMVAGRIILVVGRAQRTSRRRVTRSST